MGVSILKNTHLTLTTSWQNNGSCYSRKVGTTSLCYTATSLVNNRCPTVCTELHLVLTKS